MAADRDTERDKWLNEQGYKVLRFWNNEVLTNIEGVLEVIRENCLSHHPLTPPLRVVDHQGRGNYPLEMRLRVGLKETTPLPPFLRGNCPLILRKSLIIFQLKSGNIVRIITGWQI